MVLSTFDQTVHFKQFTITKFQQSNRLMTACTYIISNFTCKHTHQVDSQFVLNSLSRIYLVSNLSVVLASVDGRGTGFQGDK